MSATAMRPIAVKLDAVMYDRIKSLADTHQRTAHWVMREAIQQYVDREEKQLAFRQEALTAWQEYQETGLHVTANEVVNWLETWGTETETAAPICHK
jgi:predicted transcriptional regulator